MRRGLLGTTALLPVALTLLMPQAGHAQTPTGGRVVGGSAAISQSPSTTQINQSTNRAAIDWQRFDVGASHSVVFNQPSNSSWTLNRVTTPDPSVIAGRISANGGVAIVNQSGVVFAQGAQVNVGSLIASAANITTENFMNNRMVFDGAPRPGARVENHGTITVAERGLAALVAPGVANRGVIQARLGRVALAGAETFALDLAGDGLVRIDVTQAVRQAPDGTTALVTNSGVVEAQGGTVLLSAHAAQGLVETVVRNTGRVSANAAGGRPGGTVVLRGEGGNVQVAGVVEARGGIGQQGGRVAVEALGGAVTVAPQARVDASGGAGGGTVQIGGQGTRSAQVDGAVLARGNGARARGGQIAVQASEAVTLGAGARVDASGGAGGGTALIGTEGVGRNQVMAARTTVARGATVRADATVTGNGGTVVVNSTERTEMLGLLSARGGAQGGNGGFVELSGLGSMTVDGTVLLDAPLGQSGTLLINPTNITITAGGTTTIPGNGRIAFDDPSRTGNITIKASDINTFTAGTTVILEASSNITVDAAIARTTAGGLTLDARGGNVTLNQGISLADGSLTILATALIDVKQAVSVAGGDITLRGAALTTRAGGTLTTTPGRTISLRADTISLGAIVSAGKSGRIEVGALSPNANLVIGSTGTPWMKAAEISLLSADTVRLGRTTQAGASTVTAGQLTVASGVLFSAGTRAELIAGGITTTASVGFNGSGNGTLLLTATGPAGIAIGADLSAGTGDVTLTGDAIAVGAGTVSGGSVTLAPFSADTAVSLGGTGPGGLVLDTATLDRIQTPTLAVRATNSGALTVDASIDRGVDTLDLEGASISQAAKAVITAGRLRAVGRTGAVALTDPDTPHQVGRLAGSAATDFSFRNGIDLTIGAFAGSSGVTAGGADGLSGAIDIQSTAALRVEAAVVGGGPVALTATGNLTVTSTGIVLSTNDQVSAISTTGTLANQGQIVSSGLNGGTVSGVSVTNAADAVIALGDAGTITATGTGLADVFSNAGVIHTGTATAGARLDNASGSFLLAAEDVSIGTALDNQGTLISRTSVTAGTITNSGTLAAQEVSGAITNTGTIHLSDGITGLSDVTLSSGTWVVPFIEAGRDILLEKTVTVRAGSGLGFHDEGGPADRGVARAIGLGTSPGTLYGFAIDADAGTQITLNAAGKVTLSDSAQLVAGSGTANGDILIQARTGSITINDTARISVASLALPDEGGVVTLLAPSATAPNGLITEADGAVISARRLRAEAGNAITLTAEGNAIGVVAAHSAHGDIGVVSTRTSANETPLTVGTVTSRSITLRNVEADEGSVTLTARAPTSGTDISDLIVRSAAIAQNNVLLNGRDITVSTAGSWVLARTGRIDLNARRDITNNGQVYTGRTETGTPNAATQAAESRIRAGGAITNAGLMLLGDPRQGGFGGLVTAEGTGTSLNNTGAGVILAGTVETTNSTSTLRNDGQVGAFRVLAGGALQNGGTIITLNTAGAGLSNGAVARTDTAGTVRAVSLSLVNTKEIYADRVVGNPDVINNAAGALISAGRVEATRDVVNITGATIQDGTLGTGAAGLALGLAVNGIPPSTPVLTLARANSPLPDAVTIAPTSGGVASTTDLAVIAGRHILTGGTIESRPGGVRLETTDGTVLQSGGLIRAGGGVTGSATGTLTLAAGLTGTDPDFGHVWQVPSVGGGVIKAGTVTGSAARSIFLDGANEVGTLRDLAAGTKATNADEAVLVFRTVTATSDVPLAIEGTVSAGIGTTSQAGGTILLHADDLTITGTLRTASGQVVLAPHTAGRGVTLGDPPGSGSTGTLWLTAAELKQIHTGDGTSFGNLIIGEGTTGDITLGGSIDLRPVPLADTGVRGLRLETGASVTQSEGILSVERLNVLAPHGSVDLRGKVLPAQDEGNPINQLVAIAGTGITSRGTADLRPETPTPVIGIARPRLDVSTPSEASQAILAGGDARITLALPPAVDTTSGLATGGTAVPSVLSPVVVGDAQTLSLRADDLDLQARLVAPRGAIEIRPLTDGRAVTLGGTVADTLSLSAAEIELIGGSGIGGTAEPARVLRIGRTLSAIAEETAQTAGSITLPGNVLLRTGIAAGEVRAQGLELFSAGSISQTAGMILDVGNLAGESRLGTALNSDLNRVDRLAPREDTPTVSFHSGTAEAADSGFGLVTTSRTGTLAIDASVIDSGTGGAPVRIQELAGHATIAGTAWVLSEAGTVLVIADGSVTNQGFIISAPLAGGEVTAGGDVINTGFIALGSTGRVTAGLDVVNSNDILARTVHADVDVDNSGRIGAVTVTADRTVFNSGHIGAGEVTAGLDVHNGPADGSGKGVIESGGPTDPLSLTARELRDLAMAGASFAQNPIAVSGGDLAVTAAAGSVFNAGFIGAGRDLTVTAGLDVRNGRNVPGQPDTTGAWLLAQAGRLLVDAGGDVVNNGQIYDARTAGGSPNPSAADAESNVLAGGSLTNSGLILLGDPRHSGFAGRVTAAGGGTALTNDTSGRIFAGTVETSGVGAISNSGQIGAFRVLSGAALDNGGTIVALNTAGAGLSSANSAADPAGTVRAVGDVVNTGAAAAGAGIYADVALHSLSGRVVNRAVEADPDGAFVTAPFVSAATDIVNDGTILATTVIAAANLLNGTEPSVRGQSTARIAATTVQAVNGLIENAAGATILRNGRTYVGATIEAGTIATPVDYTLVPAPIGPADAYLRAFEGLSFITAPKLTPSGGTTRDAGVTLAVSAGQTITSGGTLSTADSALTITAGGDIRQTAGRIIAGGNSLLTLGSTGGSITQDAPARLAASRLTASAAGGIVLTGTGSSVPAEQQGNVVDTVLDMTARGGLLALRTVPDGRALPTTVTGALGGEMGIALDIRGSAVLTGATLTANRGDATVDAGGSLTATGARLSAPGLVRLRAGLGASLTDTAVTRSGALQVTAGGGLTATRTTAVSDGTIALQAGADAILASTALTSSGGDATVDASGSLTAANATIAAPGLVRLHAGLGTTLTDTTVSRSGTLQVTASGGGLSATRVNAVSDSSIAFAGAGDGVLANATLTARGGDATVNAGGNLTTTATTISAPGLVRLQAGLGATLTDTSIGRSGNLAVTALGGALTATRVTATAGGTMALTARSSVILTGGSYTADRFVAAAGPASSAEPMTVNGTAFRIGTAALFAAGGGISALGATVQPRSAGLLPVVMFDTRRIPGALRAIPAGMTADTVDRPGLEPPQQTWQVVASDTQQAGRLFFGRDDGSGTGAPTNAAAGDVALALDAGFSPVFLLLDGGRATGQLNAGRLGVHGIPAPGVAGSSDRSVDLSGVLNGAGGNVSAQFGRTTATEPADQTAYRFNNCVIGSINCFVISRAQPLPLPTLRELTVINREVLDADVVLPNVSAEDEREDN